MRLSSISTVVLSALLSSAAEARSAHVYTSASTSTPWIDSLTFSTLRSILAQRLGVAQYHTLDDSDDNALQALNAFSSSQTSLFAEDDTPSPSEPELLIVLEDVDDVDVGPSDAPTSFQMPSPPSAASTKQFLNVLGAQYGELNQVSHAAAKECTRELQQQVADFGKSVNFDLAQSSSCLMVMHGRLSADARKNGFGKSRNAAQGVLAHLQSLKMPYTLVLIEPESAGSLFKRSTPGSWGTYALPRRSAQKKTEPAPTEDMDGDGQYRPGAKSSSSSSGSSASSTSKSSSYASSKSSASASASASATPSSSPTPPRGILPACYASKSACEDATHSCSGHGACALKYDLTRGSSSNPSAKRQDEKAGARCWACACTVDVAKTPGGLNRTTRWAGPACQKSDVSSSFWLLASASILLVGVIAWAVGLLVSMGAEELPSVIGAGVAGPRAK